MPVGTRKGCVAGVGLVPSGVIRKLLFSRAVPSLASGWRAFGDCTLCLSAGLGHRGSPAQSVPGTDGRETETEGTAPRTPRGPRQATFLQPWGLPGWVVVLSPGLVSCVRGPQGAGGCPILSATRNLLRGFEKFYLIRLHAFFDCIFAS